MPNIGERRTVGGVTGEWDGEAWVNVTPVVPAPSDQGGELLPAAIRAASSFGGPLVSAGGEAAAQLAEMATGRRTPSIYPSEAFGLSPLQIGVAGATGFIPGAKAVRGLRMVASGAARGGITAAAQEAASAYERGQSPQDIATQAAKAGGVGAVTGAITPVAAQAVESAVSRIPNIASELMPGTPGRLLRLFRRVQPETSNAVNIPNLSGIIDPTKRRLAPELLELNAKVVKTPEDWQRAQYLLKQIGVGPEDVTSYMTDQARLWGKLGGGGRGPINVK